MSVAQSGNHMKTDTAQALEIVEWLKQLGRKGEVPSRDSVNDAACIRRLVADIKDAQEELRVCQQEAITVTAQLAQAREALAALMLENGFATGHGDSHADLCMEFSWQLKERSAQLAQVLERERWVTLWKRHEEANSKGIIISGDGKSGCYNIEQEAYAAIRALNVYEPVARKLANAERKLAKIEALVEDQQTIEDEIQPEFLHVILAVVRGEN